MNTSSSTCEVTKFLVAAGQSLLQPDSKQDWLDIPTLARHCKKSGITLDGQIPDEQTLEKALRRFFGIKDEIYTDGLNIVAWERRIKWDLILCVRFYPFKKSACLDEVQVLEAGKANEHEQAIPEIAKLDITASISQPLPNPL